MPVDPSILSVPIFVPNVWPDVTAKKVEPSVLEWKEFAGRLKDCPFFTEAMIADLWKKRADAPSEEKSDELTKATKVHQDLTKGGLGHGEAPLNLHQQDLCVGGRAGEGEGQEG